MGKPASLFGGGAQAGGCAKICLATAAACTSDDIGALVNSECRSESVDKLNAGLYDKVSDRR